MQRFFFMTILSLWVSSRIFGSWTLTTEPRKGVEIEHVWWRPWRSGRWFFLNRYFAFFGNLAVIATNFIHLSPAVRFTIFTRTL